MSMKSKLLFLFIILLAIFLRFYQLGANPPFLNWDETAWGYNAYALGVDGKDEFGRFLPIDYLESFGDYKPPMYAYLDVLPVKVFGLTPFATRFPSAFFGVLTVIETYFLVKRLFSKVKHRAWYALASSFVLALSPWHIMLSRAAFEANVGTFFLVTGVWLFLGAIQDRKWYLILSAISFVACIYTFNSVRIVAPLVVVTLSLLYWRQLWERRNQAIIAALVGIILLLPIAKFLISPQAKLRFQEVNIFSDVSVVQTLNKEVQNDHNAKYSKILHHRYLAFGADFLKHYLDNVGPGFLFGSGDNNPEFSIQDVGQMYLWDIPFFVLGIFLLFRRREGEWWVAPVWLALGIIPAATAMQTPHALRIEATLPTFQIFVGYGLVAAYMSLTKYISRPVLRNTIVTVVLLLLAWNVFYFQHSYYTYYPYRFSGIWEYGYKDSVAYVGKVQSHYDHIVVVDTLGRPYIYYLFLLKVPPQQYRNTAKITRDNFGFVHVDSFGKFIFAQNAGSANFIGKVLYIDSPQHAPADAHVLKQFKNLDGTISVEAYTL